MSKLLLSEYLLSDKGCSLNCIYIYIFILVLLNFCLAFNKDSGEIHKITLHHFVTVRWLMWKIIL